MKKGKLSTVHTARGSVVKTRFALVDASEVIPSHVAETLEPNPSYPAKLQPRDRGRVTSEQQIEHMRKHLRPELLADSLSASEGSPIVGSDLLVESGNARAISVIRAYHSGTANRYRRFVITKARELGLSETKATRLPMPMIVRVRETKIARVRFVVEANEATVAAMSDAEQGRIDAGKMSSALLSTFSPTESGEIMHDGNLGFIRRFFDVVVSSVERGRYLDSTGYLSQQGAKRIRNAVLAKAISDTEAGNWVLERISESMDDNIRRLSNALIKASPQLVSLKQAIEDGYRYPLDLTPDLAAGMKTYAMLKSQGKPVQDHIDQGALFGAGISKLEALVLTIFAGTKKERAGLDLLLSKYVALVHDLGNPNQLRLTTQPVPDKLEVLSAAVEYVEEARRLAEDDTPKRPRKRKGLSLVRGEQAA